MSSPWLSAYHLMRFKMAADHSVSGISRINGTQMLENASCDAREHARLYKTLGSAL